MVSVYRTTSWVRSLFKLPSKSNRDTLGPSFISLEWKLISEVVVEIICSGNAQQQEIMMLLLSNLILN